MEVFAVRCRLSQYFQHFCIAKHTFICYNKDTPQERKEGFIHVLQ